VPTGEALAVAEDVSWMYNENGKRKTDKELLKEGHVKDNKDCVKDCKWIRKKDLERIRRRNHRRRYHDA
jgi:hypothetical protein